MTVRVDDLLWVSRHPQSFPKSSRACAMRASHSSWRANRLARHQRRLVEQPRAVARIELDDLELVRRRPHRARSWRTRGSRGPLRTCISSRCEPNGVTSSNRTTHRRAASGAPARAAVGAISLRVLARRSRDGAGRRPRRVTASASISAPIDGDSRATHLVAEPALLVPGPHQVVLRVHVAQLVDDRPHDLYVLLVQGGVHHHRRVDDGFGAAPRRHRGDAVQHCAAPRSDRPGVELECVCPPRGQRRIEHVEGMERLDAVHQQVLGEPVQRPGGEPARVDLCRPR